MGATNTGPTVLVVDDDPDIRTNMQDVLGAFGYRVDLAHDGERASELAARNLYDVALVDLRMPGIDGVELYQRIKRIQAGVAFFIITAFTESDRAQAATEAGAWEVVPKPLDFARLLDSIQGALQRPLLIVVDDDEELCLSLWDLLRQRAFRVCLAHDVEDAERKLAARRYDAALIDLRLPGGGGTAVLHSLRKRTHREGANDRVELWPGQDRSAEWTFSDGTEVEAVDDLERLQRVGTRAAVALLSAGYGQNDIDALARRLAQPIGTVRDQAVALRRTRRARSGGAS